MVVDAVSKAAVSHKKDKVREMTWKRNEEEQKMEKGEHEATAEHNDYEASYSSFIPTRLPDASRIALPELGVPPAIGEKIRLDVY